MHNWNEIIYENLGRFCVSVFFVVWIWELGLWSPEHFKKSQILWQENYFGSRTAFMLLWNHVESRNLQHIHEKTPKIRDFWPKMCIFEFSIFWVRKLGLWSPENFNKSQILSQQNYLRSRTAFMLLWNHVESRNLQKYTRKTSECRTFWPNRVFSSFQYSG